MNPEIAQYYRVNKLPHIWCPGCSNGIVVRSIVEAIDKAGLDQDKTVIVSGIGCSSRAPGYMNFDTLHTTHGRALAFATGVKLAKPELNVFVITGDGDCTAIGGNHFIHAARRNIDLNVILFNNNIYGMTGGQYSPTSPTGTKATTAVYGNIERSFDSCKLAQTAGASYVARGNAFNTRQLTDIILKGIENPGFSFIEALSSCPVYYGRRNKKGGPADMLKWQRDVCVTQAAYDRLPEEKRAGKIITGVLHHEPQPEYTAEYAKIIEKAQGGNG
ncbi:2-oxoacid:ferredoxin oxidoreductase subunit beta [Heliophilum fasciatum]|uniref:2-oxoglutarate ferredoxin oxidoreductase subunit beta n=1 Tax=Heliophilum fasciatum TaxID=35700 RepID=A0A4R2RZ95_9FIRM|nr:2-oxoacid:ferredoxin oxidoreductase subunit beta [Heliophilum fasciatum]MCW2277168.1 2-oxoglutarate ferredoxin oxidoreductase subunit beta [Heliophilum fasciatum]TCP68197.1 2-oxoglutarate ferredoxin oxidoreductase subunit beta [Heliophilum fasciatum]